jgi:hypothetical protein
MEMLHHTDGFFRRPTTGIGRVAAAIGLPAGVLAVALLVSSAGADDAGLAILTFLSILATLLGGLLGAMAMIFRGERSPAVVLVLVLSALPLAFVLVEVLFPHG